MSLNTLTPNIMVEDVAETVGWYEEVLDADLVATLPPDEGEPWWAQVVVDDVTLMFQTRDSLAEEFPEMEAESGPGTATFYIDVHDIRHLYDTLEGEATLVQELSRNDYGRNQFAIQDCNDYILWFAEPVTNEPDGPIIR